MVFEEGAGWGIDRVGRKQLPLASEDLLECTVYF